MPTKEHFKWKGMSIVSDVRDICLAGELDYTVYQWCEKMNVDATIFMKLEDNSVWRIKDEEQRIIFRLAWT